MYEDEKIDKFHFEWKIKNFSFASNKTDKPIESPSFFMDETEWYLEMYPRDEETYEYIDIHVIRCTKPEIIVTQKDLHEIPIICTIELEAADSSRQRRKVSPVIQFEAGRIYEFNQYIKRKTLKNRKSKFLLDDTLTIHCTLERLPLKVQYVYEYIAERCLETVNEFTWVINNWPDFGEVTKDVNFTGEYEAAFKMSIHESEDSCEKLILKVEKLRPEKTTFAHCCISIEDTEGCKNLFKTTYHNFIDDIQTTSRHLFDRKEIKDSYLQDDNLTLKCKFYVENGEEDSSMTEIIHKIPIDDEDIEEYINEELVKDYENLYLNGEFSDVKVRAGNKIVNCHKSILYARSPVMSELLDRAEKAPETSVVIDIDDLDGDTMEQMIYFMYCDKIRNIKPTNALKLFVAGHKYQIKYLKEKCSSYLSTAFSFENVYDIVVAAYLYKDGALKRSAINYICKYFSRIALTSEWMNFRKNEKEISAYVCGEIRRIKHL